MIAILEARYKATSIEPPTQHSQREKIRQFIVFRYDALLKNVHQGEGENLSAVIHLLRIPAHGTQDARDTLQTFATTYSDAGIFADHVVETFCK